MMLGELLISAAFENYKYLPYLNSVTSVVSKSTTNAISLFLFCYFLLPNHPLSLPPSVSVTAEPLSENSNYEQMATTDDFERLVTEFGDLYVDKSSLIEEYLNAPVHVVQIIRPRGFGKTVNAKMLRSFLEMGVDEHGRESRSLNYARYKLFAGGRISFYRYNLERDRHATPSTPDDDRGTSRNVSVPGRLAIRGYWYSMEHQGKFPVIYFTFRTVVGLNYTRIQSLIRQRISALFREYGYLKERLRSKEDGELFDAYSGGNVTTDQLKRSLRFLSESLRGHFERRVHVLIDDYDLPVTYLLANLLSDERIRDPSITVTEAYGNVLRAKELSSTWALVKDILDNVLELNDALQKGLITGTFNVVPMLQPDDYFFVLSPERNSSSSSSSSSDNDGYYYNDQFSRYYGFRRDEIDCLLRKTLLNNGSHSIRNWYGGYNNHADDRLRNTTLYNPRSVISYLCGRKRTVTDTRFSDKLISAAPTNSTRLADVTLMYDDIQPILHNLLEQTSKSVSPKDDLTDDQLRELDLTGTVIVNYNKEVLFAKLLSFVGYLNPNARSAGRWNFTVPNVQMENVLRDRVSEWLANKLEKRTTFDTLYVKLVDFKIEHFREDLLVLLSSIPDSVGKRQMETYHNGIMISLIGFFTKAVDLYDVYLDNPRRGELQKHPDVLVVTKSRENDVQHRDSDQSCDSDSEGVAVIIRYETLDGDDAEEIESKTETGFKNLCRRRHGQIRGRNRIKTVLKLNLVFCGRNVTVRHRITNKRNR